ncbi:MAG: type VII secretion protein EssC, partial [Clostridium sp.]|nr:type VII secretion protein EssC [Clostridium sp.]
MVRDLEFYNILILYNEDFYKELDLDEIQKDSITVGNTADCTINLNFNNYHDISVKFVKKNDSWILSGESKTYCVINGVKVPRKNLVNGDKIVVKNIETKEELFRINYFIDFVVDEEDYNREILLNKIKKIKIGSGKNNNIIIDSKVIKKNHAEILSKNYKYFLKDLDSEYGTFLNGRQINEKVELKDNDFIILGGYKFLFKEAKLFMSQTEKIHINDVEEYIKPFNSLLTYPCFYRSPRLLKDVPDEDVIIDPPPTKEKQQSVNNLIVTLIPLLGTAALTLSVQASKDDKSSLVLTIGMAALTGVVALFTFAMELYQVKKNQYIRYKRYKEYVKEKEQLIVSKRKLLMESIRNNNPDTEDCISFLDNFSRRLWERTPQHKDFLNISLGRGDGDLTFDIKVESKKVEINIDKLKDDPRKLKGKYGSMEDVPICLNLTQEYPIGIYGNRKNTIELIKNIVIKISTLHYYDDVKIAAIFPKKEEKMWEWIKWIPHTWNKDKSFRYIGDTKESAHNVLNQLYDEIKQRGSEEDVKDEEKIYIPYYIIIISDRVLIENEPIMEIIESNKKCGACGIFVYEDLGLIPKDSKKIINVQNRNTAEYINVVNSNKIKKVTFNEIKDDVCDNFSRKMCPIYVKNSFTQSSLTSYFTLFDLYHIKSEDELPIITNWNKNKVYKTMAVPLGVRAGNEVVYLNLHEKYHGPHGLVAGTTGSGKSEILQTYIASLAINYHPYDVSIIIIDYKGGGMANQFKNLPHLVGTITNLDGNQINRALISIKSELKRRQRIFSEYNVNHIDSYIKLYKEGKAKEPLPHLIMIADEFAELKNDQPDFMTELVSAARIGRSLGVHLILATQKPSGVVDDQIWSNSKFKLCLKVQDADDSNEMIKSPLAANIVEAGRAYFQVGNNEIFELFQSAWSGAKKYDNDDISKK